MNGRLFFLVVSFILVIMPQVHAQILPNSSLCPLNPDVPINVTPVFEDPTYNYSANIAQLTMLSKDSYHVIPEALTLGLTHYQPELKVNPVNTARDLPDGSTCVRVERVDITFGYKNVIVYVASEIPQGTCGFEQVMLHEQKHVAVQKKIIDDFIPVLQQKLKAYLAENGAQQSQNYGQAVTWLRENVEQIAEDTIKDVMQENLRLQHNIDTVEEYTRVGNTCGGQLHQVVQYFLNAGQ